MSAPPAVFGIDRAEAPPAAWLRALYDGSNLRITGAYVDGPPRPGHPAGELTTSARAAGRHWMQRVPEASRDGWGLVLFYLGYSSGSDGSADGSVHPPTGQPTVARGRVHAQHLKHVVGTQIPGWAGAVVMIDNENSESFDLDAPGEMALRDYYLALCDELVRPGPDGAPAMRPGFYLHAPVARPLLRARPDLFLWDVQIDVADPSQSTTTRPPFDPAATRIQVAPEVRIRAAAVSPVGRGAAAGGTWSAWPVGRQFRFYTGLLPQRATPTLRPTSTFDFDCSFVRDAAFPVGEPRLAALSGGPDAAVLRGSYAEPVRAGDAAALPRMDVAVAGERRATTPLGAARNLPVEPDAPLVAVPPQLPDTLLSVSRNGVVLERRFAGGTWGGWSSVGGPSPSLRRLRALAAVKRADGTTYAFTVASDHRIYGQRCPRGGVWTDPLPMGADLRLHPFSTLAATLRGDAQIELVCLDAAGRLTNVWWSTLMSNWPGAAHAGVESTPSCLVGGSLAVVAPATDTLVVVGIGRDLRLTTALFRAGRGWLSPQMLGQPRDRVTPHARIAAQVVSPSLVEVVALTHERRLVVHRLRLREGGQWEPQTPLALPAVPEGRATSAGDSAVGWTPNPFADLTLGRTAAGRSYVVVSALAAVAPRTAGIACYLDGEPTWWRYG